jgi:hypothetical protein
LLDDTSRPVTNPALLSSALAASLLTLFVVAPKLDVPARFMALAWLPFAAVAVLLFSMTGLGINRWREISGFYRGFERIHSYNMIRPRDAMATPTKAVKYYNQQYGLLRTANEDRGWGRILTTQSRFDAKWFLENDQWINEHSAKRDAIGLGKVIQDPRAIRVMALSQLARPVFGEPVQEVILGQQALVRTDEGQIVRLIKEGPHWKIYGWLGHRFAMMEQIYPTKKARNGLTPEDEEEAAVNWSSYEQETEELASQAGMAYMPSSSFAEESVDDPAQAGKPVPRGGMIRRRSRTGYARLDLAPPGALIDLTNDEKVEFVEVPAGPVPSRPRPTATPAAAVQTTPTPATPPPASVVASPAPQVTPGTGPANTASAVPEPTPVALVAAIPTPAAVGDPIAPAPAAVPPVAPGPVAVAPVTVPATPLTALPLAVEPSVLDPAVPLIAGLFEGPTNVSVPLANLWSVYFEAVEGVMRNDVNALRKFIALMSTDDRNWLQRNGRILCMLITTDAAQWTEEQVQLVACQLLLRNMPRTRIPPELVHPFWARTLIWTPQVAEVRRAFNLPLTLDELSYLQSGFAPMQSFLRKVFAELGYRPE